MSYDLNYIAQTNEFVADHIDEHNQLAAITDIEYVKRTNPVLARHLAIHEAIASYAENIASATDPSIIAHFREHELLNYYEPTVYGIAAKTGASLYVMIPKYLAESDTGSGLGQVVQGGTVGYIKDITNTRNLTQAALVAEPILSSKSLSFDGINDWLSVDLATSSTNNYTMMVAANTSDTIGVKGLLMFGNPAAATNRMGLFFNGDRLVFGTTPNTLGGIDINSAAIQVNRNYVACGIKSGDVQMLHIDGTMVAAGDVSAANSNPAPYTRLAIGTFPRQTVANFHKGAIYAAFYAPVALSDAQRYFLGLYFDQLV